MLRYTYFANSHDNRGEQRSSTWANLVKDLSLHAEGEKDGPAISVATFSGSRSKATLQERFLVALDVETSKATGVKPPDPSIILEILQKSQQQALLWTTYNHTPEHPRYRVLMPLSEPFDCTKNPELDPFITQAAAASLRLSGVSDATKFGASSLFYLPRHPKNASDFLVQETKGTPLNLQVLLAVAIMQQMRVAEHEADIERRRRQLEMPEELVKIIEQFNAEHSISDLLVQYGYTRDGSRWRSPYQHGQGGTTILPDGKTWVSFSASDADAGVGMKPKSDSQCARFGDAFALFVHYSHKGSWRSALREAR